MFRFTPGLALLLAIGVIATPVDRRSTVVTQSSTGNAGGYYYSFYDETNSAEDIVAGTGWQIGAARTINYQGSIDADNDSMLALYGWTTNPLVEYYVIETYGSYDPGSAGTHLGTVSTDGGTYDICETTRTNAPSIEGTQTFHQYLSIRQEKRTSGTITFPNHINAWAENDLDLGTWNYQIMAAEGYESSGSSSMAIV